GDGTYARFDKWLGRSRIARSFRATGECRMLKFAIRRVVLLVPVLVGLSLLVFAIARLLPGDPVALAAGPNASASEIADLAKEFGLDKSLPVQYWTYAKGLLVGDWGQSIFSRRPVMEDLR